MDGWKWVGTVAFAAAVFTGGAAWAQGDPAAGETVFRACRACHAIEPGARRLGPTLHGLFGREAGTVEGYNYSNALREADVVWDEETLAAFLADPRGYIPGNRMTFAGVKDPDKLADLIAYLKEATAE